MATTPPVAFVERIELIAAPESVRDGAVIAPEVRAPPIEAVPVAMRLASVRFPEKRPLPCTESTCVGEVVPRPKLPEASKRARSVGVEPVLNIRGLDPPPAWRMV